MMIQSWMRYCCHCIRNVVYFSPCRTAEYNSLHRCFWFTRKKSKALYCVLKKCSLKNKNRVLQYIHISELGIKLIARRLRFTIFSQTNMLPLFVPVNEYANLKLPSFPHRYLTTFISRATTPIFRGARDFIRNSLGMQIPP